MPDTDLARRVLEGCQGSGARVIRALEEEEPEGFAALAELYPRSGRAHIVGITGPPGAGKSTLVDGLVAALREREQRVAVVAIDPSSPFTGGAILGDRVRMQRHATDPGVFIRSMATRGRLGGLSRASFDAAVVLDAMGFDTILLETVGVGQDELEVVELAHTTVVVTVPGLGDDVQALKAGILEVGEVFVVNKADRPGADDAERALAGMLHLRGGGPNGPNGADRPNVWAPPLLRSVAVRGEGAGAIADACAAHRAYLEAEGRWREKRARRAEHCFREVLRDRAAARLLEAASADRRFAELVAAVQEGELDPYTAASELVAAFDPGLR